MNRRHVIRFNEEIAGSIVEIHQYMNEYDEGIYTPGLIFIVIDGQRKTQKELNVFLSNAGISDLKF